MVIDKLSDFEGFLEVVEQCKGDVELGTPEGDRLNLKSKLCQIIALSSVFPQIAEIPNVEVFAHQPEDMERIAKFLFK